MSKPIIQTSFNAGEWAPALNARVDLRQYHSGAALLRNFFVDYRGGATTRPGSRYILPVRTPPARLIPFQASFSVSYMLEFGAGYIRFFSNGAPILEGKAGVASVTQAKPGTVTLSGNVGYANGDWIFFTSGDGMSQLTGNYYIIANVSNVGVTSFTLKDLFGNPVDTTNFSTYVSGGIVQRIYTLGSPFQAVDLFNLKYAQNVNELIITNQNYPPYILTLITATNWTLAPVTFAATISPPTGLTSSTTATAGAPNYFTSYVVTSVDINGQESIPSAITTISNAQLNTACTNTVGWSAATGAVSYNVYQTINTLNAAPASGAQFGFVGNVTGTTFQGTNITQNFALTPEIAENPFAGSGVQSIVLNNGGSGYTVVPAVTFTASPGTTATAVCSLVSSGSNVILDSGGTFYQLGDILSGAYGFQARVDGITGPGTITTLTVLVGARQTGTGNGVGTFLSLGGGHGSGAAVGLIWTVTDLILTSPGTGYISTPSVGFINGGSGSGASATATLGAASAGNPSVPGFFQQRLFLGGPPGSPGQFNMSQPGAPFNFNVTNPIQDDNAIQETLTSTVLNSIKSVVSSAAGLLIFTDKNAWLLNGGSFGSPISALSLVANPQSYSGASDLPPIVTTQDILYVQAKGSIIRDLAYNFYLSSYVGADISILSSHLFYGFSIVQWCWAEEPFKLVWLVRNDGTLLTLTFIKEQELIAWAHHDTQGTYSSVATVPEFTAIGNTDAIYTIVNRTINGSSFQYVERLVELNYPQDYISSWQVDAGINYNSTPAVTFSGAQHLAGMAVTGVADGVVINFTMPVSGTFVFGNGGTHGLTGIASASVVTVGLAFTPQLQTLALDLGEPTVQGKRKKVGAVTARVRNALGLSAGKTLATVVPMADLVLGNVGTMSNAVVTGLQTTDARTVIDPDWDVFGQYFITQPNPYPASILGVIPEIEVGDDA